MANRIQLRRGIKSKLPTLAVAEGGWCTDTHEFFIGTGSGNVNMGGSYWYKGTAMNGTTATTNNYSYADCPLVKVGDMYLNTSYGYVYECTTAGKGTSAKWTYRGSIRGAAGPSGAKGDKGDDGKRNATKVIGSSAAGYKSSEVDYLCDGTDDQAEIASAIAALPSGGGKIVFLEGTYNISSEITINKNVVFEGMGNGTVFNVSDAFAKTANAIDGILLRDMKIIGKAVTKYFVDLKQRSVILDNVDLSITTSGKHGADTGETLTAFHNVKSFTAGKSKISVGGSTETKCYSIAECFDIGNNGFSGEYYPITFSDCQVELKGTHGRIHASRYGSSMNNCSVILTGSDANNVGTLMGMGCITGGTVSLTPPSGSNATTVATEMIGDARYNGVRFKTNTTCGTTTGYFVLCQFPTRMTYPTSDTRALLCSKY